ncbi:50S ribosomal protein L18, putative [Medicago truncatula]|uniref:50S ribosomal protein L18, putative n=1 Tax=Medicago truncatula TaxID=3880 RepID=G7KFC5_MEDTR|nr:50S ribosomal protein L18, putative [Medicago truncatula]
MRGKATETDPDDQNKKCLFYGRRLYESFGENPSCRTVDDAQRAGEVLVKACFDLNTRNDFGRGESLNAF